MQRGDTKSCRKNNRISHRFYAHAQPAVQAGKGEARAVGVRELINRAVDELSLKAKCADRAESCDRLAKVVEDGAARNRIESLDLTAARNVRILHNPVPICDGSDGHNRRWRDNHYDSDLKHGCGDAKQISLHARWQREVNALGVLREAVDQASRRLRVKELHREVKDRCQQVVVQHRRGPQRAVNHGQALHEACDTEDDGDARVDTEVIPK
mmetsp:Transcript_13127/g.32714  ORF Transcript_13127/g.32714 Transcript_13127/m.32714 type:complete len:212 (-) Transcript_13127:2389-3024(-)